MDKIRFGQIRAARRVLDLKERIVAGILQMPHDQLRKGERLDSIVPSAHTELARQLIGLAERVRKNPGPRVIGQTRRSVRLPFERPHCLACRYPLNVTVTAYSSRRGDYWYFKCPKCGQRYWSKDGRAHAVNPKGNWHISQRSPALHCLRDGMPDQVRPLLGVPQLPEEISQCRGTRRANHTGPQRCEASAILAREEVSQLSKFTSLD